MATFTIENEKNHITTHAMAQDAARISGAEHFRSETELAKLAAAWPAARLVAIWNSLPGVNQVKRFQKGRTGVARIWKTLQKSDGFAPRTPNTGSSSPKLRNSPKTRSLSAWSDVLVCGLRCGHGNRHRQLLPASPPSGILAVSQRYRCDC